MRGLDFAVDTLARRGSDEAATRGPEDDVDDDFEKAEKLVEATLRTLGLDPTATRAEASDVHPVRTLKRAASERPASGRDAGKPERLVPQLAAVADPLDGRLEREFGATKA